MTSWIDRVRQALPHGHSWLARKVSRQTARLRVRAGAMEPPEHLNETGVMLTVLAHGGVGYAATADLSVHGLRQAGERATQLAKLTARYRLFLPPPAGRLPTGTLRASFREPWADTPVTAKIDLLQSVESAFAVPEIVDWSSSLEHAQSTIELATSEGGYLLQELGLLLPSLLAIGSNGHDVVLRSFGRHWAQQAGFELFEHLDWRLEASRLVEEIRELLAAPICPTRTLDVLIAPDQMAMQIHESIGHALELDRILGDERNNSGSSFVTPDMVGTLRYGSPLLNVTFDPTDRLQAAAYGWDDEGSPAERAFVIRNGILERALGGVMSQARAGVPGVACSRASSWWRPPIDRMGCLNIVPGEQSMEDLVSRVDSGILLQTNLTFSIDDRRDDFQFTTERGQLIEGGRLTAVVRKPAYRGRTLPFWRSLIGVGDRSTYDPHGTAQCGKGEPQDGMLTSHASPACLFSDVDVFGAG